nr:glycosyltransferase [Eubacterium sp.]
QIITLTDEDKGYYESNLKCRCPVTRIYNPIIWPDKTYEYEKESKTIISAGRLTYQKGFDMLVNIADLFIKKYPDWKWLILGTGEDYEMLDSKIKEKGLEDQVILKGEVDNMEDYYSHAAMYVMTSRFEGLPMTLLETKPYKLPLVSFNCKTGPSELIEDGVNGYLVEEGDLEGLAKRIEELIVIPDIRDKFSDAAQYKLERFDYNSIINQWKKLLINI